RSPQRFQVLHRDPHPTLPLWTMLWISPKLLRVGPKNLSQKSLSWMSYFPLEPIQLPLPVVDCSKMFHQVQVNDLASMSTIILTTSLPVLPTDSPMPQLMP